MEGIVYEKHVEEVYDQSHYNDEHIVTSEAYTAQEYQVQVQPVEYSTSVEIPQGTIQISTVPYDHQDEAKTVYTNLESVPSSQYTQFDSGNGASHYLHQQYQQQYDGYQVGKGTGSRAPDDSPTGVLYNDPNMSSVRVCQVNFIYYFYFLSSF